MSANIQFTTCPSCGKAYTTQEACPACPQSPQIVPKTDTGAVSAMDTQQPVVFTLAINPVAKQRPRTYRTKSGETRTVTPKKTQDYEKQVARHASISRNSPDMLTGELSVSIIIRRKTAHRADIDNIVKAVMDGMEGVLYKNDSQVMELYSRLYRKDPNPGIDVIVKPLLANDIGLEDRKLIA